LDNWLSGRYRIPVEQSLEDWEVLGAENGSGPTDEKADLD